MSLPRKWVEDSARAFGRFVDRRLGEIPVYVRRVWIPAFAGMTLQWTFHTVSDIGTTFPFALLLKSINSKRREQERRWKSDAPRSGQMIAGDSRSRARLPASVQAAWVSFGEAEMGANSPRAPKELKRGDSRVRSLKSPASSRKQAANARFHPRISHPK